MGPSALLITGSGFRERIVFDYLLTSKFANDEVQLEVFRDGKVRLFASLTSFLSWRFGPDLVPSCDGVGQCRNGPVVFSLLSV